jgi:hypothetical protein
MRRLILCSLAFSLGLAVSRPADATLHRLTNIHGSSCQTQDPQNQGAIYSDTGVLVKPTPPGALVSVACPVPWSQDMSLTQSLQKVVVALDWTSVPVSGPVTFNPSCMFYFLTNNNGELWIPLTQVNNPGTANPEFIFNSQVSLAGTPLPAYGTVIGSALYCNDVPVGVGILGYTIDTCFGPAVLSGC